MSTGKSETLLQLSYETAVNGLSKVVPYKPGMTVAELREASGASPDAIAYNLGQSIGDHEVFLCGDDSQESFVYFESPPQNSGITVRYGGQILQYPVGDELPTYEQIRNYFRDILNLGESTTISVGGTKRSPRSRARIGETVDLDLPVDDHA